MKLIKTLFFTVILVQASLSFSKASKEKNEVIPKEISMTTYSQLLGGR